MWELIPFTLATRGKCLGIKLSRETKGLYNEVVKTLKTEIAEDIRIKKYPTCSLIEIINIVKMTVLGFLLL